MTEALTKEELEVWNSFPEDQRKIVDGVHIVMVDQDYADALVPWKLKNYAHFLAIYRKNRPELYAKKTNEKKRPFDYPFLSRNAIEKYKLDLLIRLEAAVVTVAYLRKKGDNSSADSIESLILAIKDLLIT